jgi:hypothetical protein
MKKFLHLVIIFLILVGCGKSYKPSQASIIANDIQKKVMLQLKKEKNLFPCEFGSGAKNPIKSLHCGFDYYNEVDIEKGRELIILAVNKFTAEINANAKVRPYLAVYPFKPENMDVEIFFKQSNGSELSPERIHIISIINGKLRYKTAVPGQGRPLTTIHEETYEEAIAKLNDAVCVVPSGG